MVPNASPSPEAAPKDPDAFLRALLVYLNSETSQQSRQGLRKAMRDGRCLHRALFLADLLLLISLAGLGYCAILAPEVFYGPRDLLVHSLLVLGLGTLIFQVVLLGHLIWHRVARTRRQEKWLRLVLALAQSQLEGRSP